MKNYIAYLDLLGIKDIAKYSIESYYTTISQFVKKLEYCCGIFNKNKEYENSSVYYFSDCAFIKCENLYALFDYLISLRYELMCTDDPIMFTAAVGISDMKGNNDCFIDKGEYAKNIKGISFGNEDICRIYVLQNNFKGIGVFVDDLVIKDWKKTLRNNRNCSFDKEKEKYISTSFFFPSIDCKDPIRYYDIKMSENEIQSNFLESVIRRYHSANLKNKKFGRFYLSYFANWIVSEIYYKKPSGLSDELLSVKCLYNEYYYLTNSLIDNAYKFDLMIFYLLNELMNCQNDESIEDNFVSFVKFICKMPSAKKYLSDLSEIPEIILSLRNKDRFINLYQMLLKNKY